MAQFMLGDIIVDRVQFAYGEMTKKVNGVDTDVPVLLMSQLNNFTVDITAESKDAVDAQGTLVKRFWQAKTGEVTATEAMINFSALATASGTDAEMATASHTIVMPRIAVVKKGETLDITGYIEGSVHVSDMNTSGGMGQTYDLTSYNVTTADGVTTLTPPTTVGIDQYIVKYDRTVNTGAKIVNESDKFPGTIKLTVKALAIDPCSVNTLKAMYITFPSFQISPEISLSLTTDATVDFSGSLQSSYCGSEKLLYYITWADDDDEG